MPAPSLECCKQLAIDDMKPGLCPITANVNSCFQNLPDNALRNYEFVVEIVIRIPHIFNGKLTWRTKTRKIVVSGATVLDYRECARSRNKERGIVPENAPDPTLYKDLEDLGKPGTCALNPAEGLKGKCKKWADAINSFNNQILNTLNNARQEYCEKWKLAADLYEQLSGKQFPEPEVTMKSYCRNTRSPIQNPYPDHVFQAIQ